MFRASQQGALSKPSGEHLKEPDVLPGFQQPGLQPGLHGLLASSDSGFESTHPMFGASAPHPGVLADQPGRDMGLDGVFPGSGLLGLYVWVASCFKKLRSVMGQDPGFCGAVSGGVPL